VFDTRVLDHPAVNFKVLQYRELRSWRSKNRFSAAIETRPDIGLKPFEG